MYHILISGFKAFPGVPHNPSEKLVCYLESYYKNHKTIKVSALILDTHFKESFAVLNEQVKRVKPDAVISFGVNAKSDTIRLESIARNQITDKADASGYVPSKGIIFKAGEPTLKTTLPISQFKNELMRADVPVKISKSAGSYVCNDIFYRMMRASKKIPSGFIHIPADEKLAASLKKEAPYMPYDQIKRAGRIMIRACANNHT